MSSDGSDKYFISVNCHQMMLPLVDVLLTLKCLGNSELGDSGPPPIKLTQAKAVTDGRTMPTYHVLGLASAGQPRLILHSALIHRATAAETSTLAIGRKKQPSSDTGSFLHCRCLGRNPTNPDHLRQVQL